MATGFVLNIDDKLIKQLAVADAMVKRIGDTSDRVRKKFEANFGAMVTGNLQKFIDKLIEANKKLSEIGGAMNSSTQNGLGQIATQATASTDAIQLLINTLMQLAQAQQKTNTSSTSSTTSQQKIDEIRRANAIITQEESNALAERIARLKAANKIQTTLIIQQGNEEAAQIRENTRKKNAEYKAATNEQIAEVKAQNDKRIAEIAAGGKKEAEQVKINASVHTQYARAMAMSEQTELSRTKKIIRLNSVLEELNRNESQYASEIAEVTRKIAELQREQKEVESAREKLKNGFGRLGQVIGRAFSIAAIKNFVTKLMQVRGEYEQQHKAMQVLIQDYNKANVIWNKTVQLAVRSPYTIQQLTSYTKQLAAYRIESDKLYDTTKRLADVSVGLGVDMQRIILAYGQVRAANFLRGTELRQFTEAGIPLLDELAKYFSAVEHTTVTAAQVFERISKRQVLFTDVDAVIKKMTDAGGIFYNMQEEMANTLQGMRSNLKDKVYLMYNEIGTETQGLLSGILKVLGWLTENWRVLAGVLDALFLPVVFKMVIGFVGVIKQLRLMATTATRATGSFLKLAGTWKGLSALMLTTPIGLMITLVVSLGAAMFGLHKRTKAMNAELEKMRANTEKQITDLELQKQKVEENNKIIKDAGNATNLTEEAESKLAEARNENARILDELKKRHPEFYKNITQQKNGTVELTAAIEEQNKQLAQQAIFAKLVKGNWFTNSLTKNSERFTTTVAAAQKQLDNEIIEYEKKRANIHEEYVMGDISYEDYTQKIAGTTAEIQKLIAAKEKLNNLDAETIETLMSLSAPTAGARRSLIEQQYLGVLNAAKKAYDNLENAKKVMAQDLREMSASGMSQEDMAKYIHNSLSLFISDAGLLSLIEGELNKYFVEVKAIDVPLNFNFKVDTGSIEKWQENYNKAITEAISEINKDLEDSDKVYFTEITVGTSVANTRDKLIKDAQDVLSQQTDLLKRVKKASQESGDSLIGTAYEGYSIKQIEANIELQKKILDFFNAPYTKKKTDDKENKVLSKRIALLKELYQSYEKLRSKYGDEKSIQILRDSYNESLNEAFGGSLSFDNLTFDNVKEGLKGALETLRPLAEKEGKEAQNTLNKEISGVNIEIGFEDVDKTNKQLKQKVEDLFSRYNLTLDLEKLGISKDLMSSLFDVEALDLSGLRQQVASLKDQFIGTDMEDEYKKYLDRITDMEKKAAVERTKTYVKYLMEAQREAVKIKVEELRKLKEIEESKEFSPEQKEEIKDRIRKETNADLQKQEWADFQNSEMYTMMFEDLEHYGTQALETLREKLIALKGSLTDLPASEVKEIINQLSKIEDITIERNPFRALKETRKQIKAEGVSEEQAQTNLAQSENQIAKLQSELDIINIVNTAKSKGLAIDKETQYAYDDIVVEMEDMGVAEADIVKTKEKELKLEKQNAQTARQQAKNYADRDKERIAALNKTKSILGSVQDATKASMELMDSLGVSSDSIGYTLAESADGMISLTLSAIEFGIQMETVGYQSNMALGIIGWIAIGIQTVAKVLSTIFKMHDAGLQKQIDDLAVQTEDLQEKFDALSEAVDNAYNTDQLRRAAAEGKQYTEQMISNYEKMKQLEEDKKKTDKDAVKEYEDNIKEQREALRELEQQIVSEATAGILDNAADAARGFVDAWYDSFKEVGNGLKGLEDNFDEMFLDLAKQQATMQIAGNFAKQWEKDLSKYINETDTELTKAEAQKWAEEVKATFPALNDALEGFLGVVTEGVGATGELSGLQAGIQGITESQAEILTAYANSCRFFLSSINTTLSDFAAKVFDTEGDSNPILSQLRIVAQQTTAINSLLSSLTKGGHTEGGLGLKVFIN